MELTKNQKEVYDLLIKFITNKYENPKHPKELIIDGFAGTGKSTVISIFLKEMQRRGKDFAVLTYTGKASQVLQDKGLKIAKTIHSFLYDVVVKKDGTVEYTLKDINSPYCEFDKDFIVIDESSFIDDKIYKEFNDNCNKIIYVGDSYQLSLNRSDKLLEPDIVLKEPLRFSLQSYIGNMANDIRVNEGLPYTYKYEDSIAWDIASKFDIIICLKNKTRNEINMSYRKEVLKTNGTIKKNEKIMFLNNSVSDFIGDKRIVNGLIITLDKDPIIIRQFDGEDIIFKYKNIFFYFGERPKLIKIKGGTFTFSKTLSNDCFTVHPITYSYAITCHKAQGSEWDNVLLIKETTDPHYLYTGVTRAKNYVELVRRIQ